MPCTRAGLTLDPHLYYDSNARLHHLLFPVLKMQPMQQVGSSPSAPGLSAKLWTTVLHLGRVQDLGRRIDLQNGQVMSRVQTGDNSIVEGGGGAILEAHSQGAQSGSANDASLAPASGRFISGRACWRNRADETGALAPLSETCCYDAVRPTEGKPQQILER